MIGQTPVLQAWRALALAGHGQREAAWRDMLEAVRAAPQDPEVRTAQAGLLIAQGRFHEARAIVSAAQAQRPGSAAHEQLAAELQLRLGEFQAGWAAWTRCGRGWPDLRGPAFASLPSWTGDVQLERTLLVDALGDPQALLHLAGLLPLLARRVAQVRVAAPPPMLGLLRRLQVPGIAFPAHEAPQADDLYCAVRDLPALLQVDGPLPSTVGLLRADPQRSAAWRRQLGAGLQVLGLAWACTAPAAGPGLSLQDLEPLAHAGWRCAALQAPGPADQPWSGLLTLPPAPGDWDDLAACLCALDLVITVDEELALLAAALGRPVWLLLPSVPHWRWGLDRPDCPWCPTVRLFRLDGAQTWGDLVPVLVAALQARELAAPVGGPAVRQALVAQGNAALQTWDLAAAAACYRQATAADPEDPAARLNRGFVALEQGHATAAAAQLAHCLALLERRPDAALAADARFLLGKAHRQLGSVDEALACFDAAANARPGFSEPLDEAVSMLHAAGRGEEAVAWARRLVGARPGTESDLALASALCAAERFQAALDVLEQILAREPGHATAWTGRGDVLIGLRRGEEALACFKRALALVGPTGAARMNLAIALHHLGRLDEAQALLESVVRDEPGNDKAVFNLVLVLQMQGLLAECLALVDRALERWTDDARFHWLGAFAHLLRGDFVRGWPAHEWRWRTTLSSARRVDYGRPSWTGVEDLGQRTLLLWAEQGLGDSIQFLRFVPQAAARARRVLLLLPRELHPLVRRCGLPANCELLPADARPANFDFDLPLMSLPLALGLTTGRDLGMAAPYITPDPVRVRAWKARLDALGPGTRVGLAWSGNAAHRNDHNRSIPLATMRQLETPGVHFISLQPQVRDSDRAALDDWAGLQPWGTELASFEDTAALIGALDVVVCVDTSVAHLTGALGKPVWILLPFAPDWRWMLHRADSPWYPTATLYRQPVPNAWTPVLQRVRADLQGGQASRSGPPDGLTAPA